MEAHPDAGWAHRHPGELRAGGGGEGREDRAKKAGADLSASTRSAVRPGQWWLPAASSALSVLPRVPGLFDRAQEEHDKALWRIMVSLMKDDTELFKQFSDNEAFRKLLADKVFELTYGS